MASVQDALKARFSKLKEDASNILSGIQSAQSRVANNAGTAFKESFVPWSPEFQQSNRQFAQIAKQAPERSVGGYVAQGLEGLRSMPVMGSIFRDQVANAPQTTGGKVARFAGASLPAITTAGTLGAGSFAGNVLRATPAMGLQTGIGAGIGKIFGNDPLQGAVGGISSYAPISMVGGITNPLISRIAGGTASKFANPVTRSLVNRGITGVASIPEGMIMNKSIGVKGYTPTDALLDIGFGAITGGANRPRLSEIDANVYRNKNNALQEHIQTLEQKVKSLSQNGGSKTAIKQYQKAIDNAYREIVNNRQMAGKLGLKAGIVGATKNTDPLASLSNLAIRKNSPQELAYDLAGKLNKFELGDIKLSKAQKDEIQQWDNRNGNIISSRGITAVKEVPQWIVDTWNKTQQPTLNRAINQLDPLIAEARKYKSAEEFVKQDFQNKVIAGQDLGKEIGKNVNPDGTITLYHGTSKQNAENILKSGEFKDGAYFSVRKAGTEYGDSPIDVAKRKFGKDATVIEVKVDARDLESAAAGSEVFSPKKLVKQEDGSWVSDSVKTKSQLTSIYNQAKGVEQPQVLKQEQLSPRIEKVAGQQSQPRPNVLTDTQRISLESKEQAPVLGQKVKGQATPTIEDQISMQRLQGAKKIDTENLKASPKTVSSKGIISPDVANEAMAVQNAVKSKVNILDYFRTPDRVLEKIGLKQESDLLKQKYNDYLDQLPKEIDLVTSWYNRVKQNSGSEQRIFRFLDGQGEQLQGEELKVANEMQSYLKEWADKLDLPYDKRMASYITHIFEQDFIKKEFDPDIAKLITDRVPGSVYDPFLQERLGAKGYVEDAFRALDAYVKRATRKYHMDQALGPLQEGADRLDLASLKYVTRLGERINMRPTEVDELLDNLIKSSPAGYKLGQRPIANLSRKLRQMVYRGTLGLNFGSAVRNLTQGVNTYAQLGEKYTAIGYTKALKSVMSRDDELQRVGVLRDNMVQDRALSATKKFWEKLDKRLFTFFETAEKINRGSAYYGAKSKALSQGLSEQEAVKRGVEMARKTQFTFGSVDTPVALQGDLVKLLTQFQSFNVKQTEFLAEMAKNKEYAGMLRWAGANVVILYTVGQAMGWDWKDFVPFGGVLEGRTPVASTPVFTLGSDALKASVGAPDKYGEPTSWDTVAKDFIPFIPAGVQAKKTIEGLGAYNQGYSASKSGLVRYPIEKNTSNAIRTGLFGQYNAPEAREYFDKERTPLSKKQSEMFKQSGKDYYNQVMENRETNRDKNKLKEQMQKELDGETGFNPINMFKPKEAHASSKWTDEDTILYSSNGEVKELNISKYTKKPANDIERIRLEADKFSEAVKVYRNEDITKEDKDKIFGKLGVKPQDIAYYDIASDSAEVRRSAIDMVMKREYKDRTEMLTALGAMRYEITSGTRILTDTTVDELYNDGVISYAEKKYLKDVKFVKGKKPRLKSSKSSGGRKPKAPQKLKIKAIKAPNFQQLKPIQLGDIAPKVQQPKINIQPFKVQSKPLELRLDPRIRAGM